MSNSCELIAPSVSSNTITVSGSPPYNEGSNDKIEIVIDKDLIKKRENIGSAIIGPVFSSKDRNLSLLGRKHGDKYKSNTSNDKSLRKNLERQFIDIDQINVLNNEKKPTSKTKLEISEGIEVNPDTNPVTSYGITNITSFLNDEVGLKENFNNSLFVEEVSLFRSPPDLDLIDNTRFNDSKNLEYYSLVNKVSKNGLIEPLTIREESTFDFSTNSFKCSLSINDARRRSHFLKNTSNYSENQIEFFEDSVDVFAKTNSKVINNTFTTSFDKSVKSYKVVGSAGFSYNTKVLEMSWVSEDNNQNTLFQENNLNIKEEIQNSDYAYVNNDDIINYYVSNNIFIRNQYPKIYEEKHSSGYTYDRSKVQGLDSITFADFLE